jgi:hypothetical protein
MVVAAPVSYWTVRQTHPEYPVVSRAVRAYASDRPRCTEQGDALGRPPARTPMLEVMMVIFNVSPPSGVFSTTTFLQKKSVISSASRGPSMMISMPFPLSTTLGRTRIFYHQN